MEKIKLKNVRTHKGYSEKDMGVFLNMDQTTYGRKENGVSKITSKEWKKIALVLDVPIKDVFEDEERSIFINNDNGSTSDIVSGDKINYNVPDYVLLSLDKYIIKIEEENLMLKKRIEELEKKLTKND